MVHRIYPAELQLNTANASATEAAFLDLNLSIYNDIQLLSKIFLDSDFCHNYLHIPVTLNLLPYA